MQHEHGISIDLALVDDGGRRLDSAPDDVTVGAVRLHAWQIHPVELDGGLFDGADAYLVKLNYELEQEPDFPPMNWFELGLHFDGDEPATVLDAVPHGAATPQPSSSYELNSHLQLVHVTPNHSARVYLPATAERVDLYGLGGRSVRWRHSTDDAPGVQAGSRSAWALLLVSEGQARLECRLEARYALAPDDDMTSRPSQRPVTFTVTLTNETRQPRITPSRTAPARTDPADRPISIFVCYAHECPEFKKDVRKLTDLLLLECFDVHLDQLDVGPKKNWSHWSVKQIMTCDITLVIASSMCRRVGDGIDEINHPGLRSELVKVETFYQRYPAWQRYVLPVILPGQSKEGVPLFLGPENEDYYEVYDYTTNGLAYLAAAIRATGRREWRFDIP